MVKGGGNAVQSADIVDGTIVNADVAADAAIEHSKLAGSGALQVADAALKFVDLLIKQIDANTLGVRDLADSAYRDLIMRNMLADSIRAGDGTTLANLASTGISLPNDKLLTLTGNGRVVWPTTSLWEVSSGTLTIRDQNNTGYRDLRVRALAMQGGDIDLGGNKLKTTTYYFQESASFGGVVSLRRNADNGLDDLQLSDVLVEDSIRSSDNVTAISITAGTGAMNFNDRTITGLAGLKAPKRKFTLSTVMSNGVSNIVQYRMIESTDDDTVEANVQIGFPSYAFRIKRILVKPQVNGKDADSIVGFRDDGVTVASRTIAAGSTAFSDSGAIDVAVAAGSLNDWIVDTSASSDANSFVVLIILECEVDE